MTTNTTKRLLVGKINGLFGILGMVKIFSYTDPKERIIDYKKLLIKKNNNFVEFAVKSRKQGKTIASKIQGIDSPELASEFLGCKVYIDTNWLAKLDDGYYYYQLENLQVINQDNDNFGIVKYVFDTGSNSVIVVSDGKKERMIPFIKPYLLEVDLAKGQIIIDWDKDF